MQKKAFKQDSRNYKPGNVAYSETHAYTKMHKQTPKSKESGSLQNKKKPFCMHPQKELKIQDDRTHVFYADVLLYTKAYEPN